ncbi:RNA-directed DNA polymerase, eukaryota, reverse transcriptase zinc-binding domain protein [Tanacetum coccineum]
MDGEDVKKRGNWNWRFQPCDRALGDLDSLIFVVGSLSLSSEGYDKWHWIFEVSGNFKVNTLSRVIQNLLLADDTIGLMHTWISWIPRKVNICVWRAALNRLPTRVNLESRGVHIPSSLIDHCLLSCSFATKVWRKVWDW